MVILFITFCKPIATKGGTERTTISVARGLTDYYGIRCYSVYSADCSRDIDSVFVQGRRYKTVGDISNYANAIHADVVVNQGLFSLQPPLRKRLDKSIALLFCHHYQPGWELSFSDMETLQWRKVNSNSFITIIKSELKILFYNEYHRIYQARTKWAYRSAYDSSECVVLLSKGFIDPFIRFAGLSNGAKFRCIPNPLSFNPPPNVRLSKKKKLVLIVARMDEHQKRISVALKIWKYVKSAEPANQWVLHILGDGKDLKMYREQVKRQEIPDVLFLGSGDPRKEYSEASIFMMTSESEGWGLTLTEAQEYGVVPIAFNTYESLVDIVDSGKNGFIVDRGDEVNYAKRLIELMNNQTRRYEMAVSAISSSSRFSIEKITSSWKSVLDDAVQKCGENQNVT